MGFRGNPFDKSSDASVILPSRVQSFAAVESPGFASWQTRRSKKNPLTQSKHKKYFFSHCIKE
jgi:hypothetical protein